MTVEATDARVRSAVSEELAPGGLEDVATTTVGPREPRTPVRVTVCVLFSFLLIDRFTPELDRDRPVTATAVLSARGRALRDATTRRGVAVAEFALVLALVLLPLLAGVLDFSQLGSARP